MTPGERRKLSDGLRLTKAGDRVTVLDMDFTPPRAVEILVVHAAKPSGIWTVDSNGAGKTRWSIVDGTEVASWGRMIRPLRDGDEREVRLMPLRAAAEEAKMIAAGARRATEWARETVQRRKEELESERRGFERSVAVLAEADAAATAALAALQEAEGAP